MEDDQQFCLRWNNHQSTLVAVFDTLLENGTLVDCTLAAEGKYLNAHKVVLSACSPYFESLLSQNYDKHPIFILKDVKFQELKAMMDYMYRGEVNISQDQLGALLKAAESLQIKGLSDNRKGETETRKTVAPPPPPAKSPPPATSIPRVQGLTIEQRRREMEESREGSQSPGARKKKRIRRRSLDDLVDNHHDASNSSESHHSSQAPPAQNIPASIPAAPPTKIATDVPEPIETKADILTRHKSSTADAEISQVPIIKEKIETHSELMLEPKAEYIDEMNEDSIEDLTLDDDDISNMEQMDDQGAGPSHGNMGEGSGQGFGGWHMGNQSQDEVFLAAQEAVGAHRDSQEPQIPDTNVTASEQEKSNDTNNAKSIISNTVAEDLAVAKSSSSTNATVFRKPVERKLPVILYREVINQKEVEKKVDDDVQIVETNETVIDLCEDEPGDINTESDIISIGDSAYEASQDFTSGKKDLFSLTPENIATICRICLKEKDVLSLAESRHEEHTYAELLEICSTIKLQEDPTLSQNICRDCSGELLQAFHFRQKCSKSQQTLDSFKEALLESQKRKESALERRRTLTLRFHDYDQTLKEEEVQSLTETKRRDEGASDAAQMTMKLKKRFYLIKAGLGEKKSLKFKEIDETNAKTILSDRNRKSIYMKVDDASSKVTAAGVLPPGKTMEEVMRDPVLKNNFVRNINKRKMLAYTQLIRPAINSIVGGRVVRNTGLRKKKAQQAPRKRKRKNADKPPRPKEKVLVVPGVCEVCQEPYNTAEEYKEHATATKHYLNTHVCKECGNIYPNKHRLKVHWEIHHSLDKAHMCEKCGKCYKTSSYLAIHRKSHSKTDYVCKQCGSSFNTLTEVVRHKKLVHPMTKEKKHCCEYCGEFFTRMDTLRHHRNRVHLKIKRQFCQICGKGYQYKSTLKKHMNCHSTEQFDCRLCNKSFKKEFRLLMHIKMQHPGADENTKEEDEIQVIECDYCDKVLKNKQQYSMHLREHHEANTCIYCDTLYAEAEDLDDHIRDMHADIPDFSCRYCGRCFHEVQGLYAHSDKHRTRYYQCSLCFKKFPNSVRLQIHMVIHTREKQHECQYCDKTFLYSTSRVIHERLHTGERPYVCDICGKGNVCSSSYKRHRRTHMLPQPIGVTSQQLVSEENQTLTLEEVYKEESVDVFQAFGADAILGSVGGLRDE